jgi:hypothetical protein
MDLHTDMGLLKFITDNPNKLMAEIMSLPNRIMRETNKALIINQIFTQFPIPDLPKNIPSEIRAVFNYLTKLNELID